MPFLTVLERQEGLDVPPPTVVRNQGVHVLVNDVVLNLVVCGFKITVELEVHSGEDAVADKVRHEADVASSQAFYT